MWGVEGGLEVWSIYQGGFCPLSHAGISLPISGFKRRLFAKNCRKMRGILRGHGKLARKNISIV
ncbi:hypothetical protein DA792_17485 [Celeribacter baekdonensis]|uniref:Uncharacterized protein n=1 Tax=Celeribacter baekdonensis TaxID=875171 RepID=A0A2R4M663_9RHOB|nr:hypothetical protein DA792_17485 [Celeribacter baekdonensis]